jgi:hypothetical protein
VSTSFGRIVGRVVLEQGPQVARDEEARGPVEGDAAVDAADDGAAEFRQLGTLPPGCKLTWKVGHHVSTTGL